MTYTQDVDVKITKNIQRIDCKLCKSFIIIVENNKIVNIDDKFDDCVDNSWIKVF